MTDYMLLAKALFWVSVLMLSPGVIIFTRLMLKYLRFRLMSNDEAIIEVIARHRAQHSVHSMDSITQVEQPPEGGQNHLEQEEQVNEEKSPGCDLNRR